MWEKKECIFTVGRNRYVGTLVVTVDCNFCWWGWSNSKCLNTILFPHYSVRRNMPGNNGIDGNDDYAKNIKSLGRRFHVDRHKYVYIILMLVYCNATVPTLSSSSTTTISGEWKRERERKKVFYTFRNNTSIGVTTK